MDDSKNDSTGESSNNEDPGTGNSNHSNSGQNQNELEIDLSDPKYSDLKIVGNALGIDYLSYKLLAIRVTQTKLNVLSRICTHQGADMALNKKGRWNPATDTLKCASHGSLFNSEGEVTGGGKASIDLRKYKVEFIPEKDYLKIDLKS